MAECPLCARSGHRTSERGLQVDQFLGYGAAAFATCVVGGADIELAANDVRELNDVLVKQPVRGARYYEQLMEMIAARDGRGPRSPTEPGCGYRDTTHMFLDPTP